VKGGLKQMNLLKFFGRRHYVEDEKVPKVSPPHKWPAPPKIPKTYTLRSLRLLAKEYEEECGEDTHRKHYWNEVNAFLNWLKKGEELREGELRKLYGVKNDKVE